ncbi:MAG TPA: phospholipase D-like domain-containing protein [Kofleriaceae bacterium]|nr:phospholipase D-like domain-containing protein [Kofleriaceae bacterium]
MVPGLSCAEMFPDTRSGVLVDGRTFYKAVYEACCQAEHTILMTGWQFASKVELVRGDDATTCELPTTFVDFLRALCEKKPQLHIYLLAWDSSAVFTFEREPLQRLKFQLRGHERIHWKMDNKHPRGASHHQKLIVVDRAIAFVGGMDVCNSRWDDRDHSADSNVRCEGRRRYTPYHDVQAYVTGAPVDTLRRWFCDRWQLATREDLCLAEVPQSDVTIRPTFDVTAPTVALTRTWPRMQDPPAAPIRELYELHVRAIAQAERVIYFENQYLSSDEIADALERRMLASSDPPLEIVFVLPSQSAGFKERISIGVYQAKLLERLGEVAARTGHHLGVYYSCACGQKGEVPVFIHAKVLAVDDRFLLVSSANTSNRSMGFDTELGLAWEAPQPTASLRRARVDLMAEHAGLDADEATARLADPTNLVPRLDELAQAKHHKLRIHKRNVDEKPGRLLSWLIPEKTPFDPDDPQSFNEALPEPSAWLDRVFREPYMIVKRAVRYHGGRARRHRLRGADRS